MFNFLQIKTGCVMVLNNVLMVQMNLGAVNLDCFQMIDINAFLMAHVYRLKKSVMVGNIVSMDLMKLIWLAR